MRVPARTESGRPGTNGIRPARTTTDEVRSGGTAAGGARLGAAEPAAAEPPQQRLAELFAARALRVGREPVTGPAPDGAAESPVLVLLRNLDLAGLVDGVRRFAVGLGPAEAADWERSWTLTRFLFGNPANLAGRLPVRAVAPGGTAAWLGPFPGGRLPGASRLLKPVRGRLPRLPATVVCPPATADSLAPGRTSAHGDAAGPERPAGSWAPPAVRFGSAPLVPGAGSRRLYVAVRGLGLVEYLVHLHHTLAEAVLLGQLGPHECFVLTHCQDISAETAAREPGYARVHFSDGDPDRLRLYTWLDPKEVNP
ncbi:DUF6182 family protein [Streptomyces sp. NBC_01506]|uniref:DUF6182 family protein n=1 Tax=Streptomyces sp. NBC_01506 TaxID=2903887 RepID=UPI003863DA12